MSQDSVTCDLRQKVVTFSRIISKNRDAYALQRSDRQPAALQAAEADPPPASWDRQALLERESSWPIAARGRRDSGRAGGCQPLPRRRGTRAAPDARAALRRSPRDGDLHERLRRAVAVAVPGVPERG